MARLFVLSGNSLGATFDFDETSTIGRGDDADIMIAEASISRQHARLVPRPDPGLWKVVDLNSSNGVFVGGKRVKSGIVGDGDTFRLGEVELRLRDEAGAVEPEEFFEDEPIADVADVSDDFGFDDSADDDADDSDGGFELEFGEDLDEAIQAAPKEPSAAPRTAARTLPPTGQDKEAPAAGARAGARATEQRSQRRQDALKGGSVAARAAVGSQANAQNSPAGGGRAVLQYASANHRASGADLAQMSGGKRVLIILLGVALMGGLAYGAFNLTRTARSQSAVLAD